MHDALAMRVIERSRDLLCDANRLGDRQLLLARQARAQRLAAHIRDDVEEEVIGGAGIDQREDVRMVEPGGNGDLTEKPLRAERSGELLTQDLDRYRPVVPLIVREIHRRHPAAAELPLDAVPAETRESADPILKALIEGVELTERSLLNALEKNGVKKFDPSGEKFDPNFQQAMYEAPDASVPPGTVVQVVQAGYMIGDRVLRPALVAVSKGGAKAGASEQS